ncbi:hypothetical protein FACS1894164_14180 [Spirochaetia bacterium]|nr:hypothetical protein FACS1894164_14180 [Spirochaetia bacterium]
MFSNGIANYPDEKELKLSTAFEREEGNEEINLELTVRVYNINKGHNEYLIEKNETLSGYVEFVDRVRNYQEVLAKEKPGINREAVLNFAIVRAIEYCKHHNILADFWNRLTNEEVNMLTSEWNLEDALAVREEEAKQEERDRIMELLNRNYTVEQLKEILTQESNECGIFRPIR